MSVSSRWAILFCVWGVLGSVGCGETKRPDGGKGLLTVGSAAPELRGVDAQGVEHRLSAVRGAAVVYFYPKDGTPGCTKEACAFRDAFDRYVSAGVTIFGVSGDSAESHAAFAAEHKLPFPLVADEAGQVAAAYGVGTSLGMPSRVTFLVGPDHTITHVFPDVDPAVHADQVLSALR